jgi:SAM-dependent methyltransferase
METNTYFTTYEEWSSYSKEALQYVKGRVLDVGCGAGRHALYLQYQGFDVLGIDISPTAIEVCRLRGLTNAEVMSLEDVNFAPNSFDTILMMGNNFGLFGSFDKAQQLLNKFHTMTSEHALIIAESNDPYQTINPFHLEYHRRNKIRGRMGGQLKMRVRFQRYMGRWFDYLMVSQQEMHEILKGTGWQVKTFICSDDSQYIAIIGSS